MPQTRIGEHETAEQRRAFEDYWALGYGRSVRKLVQEYRGKRAGGEKVPSAREATLEEWCAALNWTSRCAQREAEEAAERRAKTKERADKFRDRVLRAIEIDASAYAQRVFGAVGPDGALGAPVMIEDAASLERAVKLFFQLAENPLSDKHDLDVSLGGQVHSPVRIIIGTVAAADPEEVLSQIEGDRDGGDTA
jgi:hypothetical protein